MLTKLVLIVWDELSLSKIFKYWSETNAFGGQGRGLFAWHAAGQKTANLGGPEIHHRVFRQNTTWKLNQSSIWKIQQVSHLDSNIRLTLLTWFALTSDQEPLVQEGTGHIFVCAGYVRSWAQSPYIKKTVTHICVGTTWIINMTFCILCFQVYLRNSYSRGVSIPTS